MTACLSALAFEGMDWRFQSIEKAHQDTFEWIYESEDVGFTKWLREEDGVFWITGKPGSGKSTLMKLLFKDPRTVTVLPAAGQSPTIVGFFFHDQAGAPLLKTRRGLLQSLLFQLLDANKQLIQHTLPRLWQEKEARLENRQLSSTIQDAFPMDELEDGFRYIARQSDVFLNCCLFIDGLDEFEGDHFDNLSTIRDFMETAKAHHTIHMCLASRPLPVFKQFLEGHRSVQVQFLTAKCIDAYALTTIKERCPTQHAISTEPDEMRHLAKHIRRRSGGVFLWAKIVVKSVINGMLAYDSFGDLYRRLEQLPEDLNNLFEYLVRSIDAVHREEVAKVLLLVRESGKATPLSLILALEEEHHDLDYPCAEVDLVELTRRQDQMVRRIEARLCGLVEYEDSRYDLPRQFAFLHSSFREYLRTSTMIDWLASSLANTSFNVHVAVIKSSVCQLRLLAFHSSLPPELNDGHLRPGPHVFSDYGELVLNALRHGQEAEKSGDQAYVRYLTKLSTLCSRQHEVFRQQDPKLILTDDEQKWERRAHKQKTWVSYLLCTNELRATSGTEPSGWETDFESWAIRFGLQRFVEARINSGYQHIEKPGRPLLGYAADPDGREEYMSAVSASGPTRPRPNHIRWLLESGCDPNQRPHLAVSGEFHRKTGMGAGHVVKGYTPWQAFLNGYLHDFQLSSLYKQPFEYRASVQREYFACFLHFLRHGADPLTTLYMGFDGILSPLRVLEKYFPDVDVSEISKARNQILSHVPCERPKDGLAHDQGIGLPDMNKRPSGESNPVDRRKGQSGRYMRALTVQTAKIFRRGESHS